MSETYSPKQTDRYCARVGFFGATQELVATPSLEIKIVSLPSQTGCEDDFFHETLDLEKREPSVAVARFPHNDCDDDLDIARAAGRIA
jgi:hypothetical protein